MKKIKKALPYIIILILAFILILMSNTCFFGKVGLFWDAAVYLNVSKNLVEGQVLYKDIVDNKGPVLYFINYIGLKLGGEILVCFIEFTFIYISLLYMYKCVQLINDDKIKSLLAVFITFICYALFFTYGLTCESYALTFSMIAMYECIKFYKNDRFTKVQCIIIGVLCALTFFIRANLINVFIGFGLGIGIKLIINKRFKELLKYVLYSFIGFFIICIPIFMYLVINNCMNEFINNVFLINTELSKIGITKAIRMIARMIPITYIIIIIYMAIAVYSILNKKQEFISIMCLIIITIYLNSISADLYYHYLIAFLPIILLAYNKIIEMLSKIMPNKKFSYVLISLSIVVYLTIEHFYKINYKKIFIFETYQPNNEIIKYIQENTDKTDKIAVLDFADEIYYLSDRRPVSRITYVLSLGTFESNVQTNMLEEYMEDIYMYKPKIIVEDEETMEGTIKKCIDVSKYEELKDEEYMHIGQYNKIKIYQLKE